MAHFENHTNYWYCECCNTWYSYGEDHCCPLWKWLWKWQEKNQKELKDKG